MTVFDYLVLAVVAVSAVFSVIRGFVREAASVISWVAAFVLAAKFYDQFAPVLTFSDDALTRNLIAVVIIFIVALLVIGLVTSYLCRIIHKAGLSGVDRLLGVVFGVVRGILIVCAVLTVVMILQKLHLTGFITDSQWWQESMFRPYLERIVHWIFTYLELGGSGE